MDQRVALPQTTVSKSALLKNGNDLEFRTMVHDLLAVTARLDEIRGRLGSHIGLTGSQYTILISVNYLGGQKGVGISAIAKHLSLSGAFVTIETKKLIMLGLLKKAQNPDDKRRVLLTVSVRGASLLEQLRPVQLDVNDTLFRSMEHEDFRALSRMANYLKSDADKAILLLDYLTETK